MTGEITSRNCIFKISSEPVSRIPSLLPTTKLSSSARTVLQELFAQKLAPALLAGTYSLSVSSGIFRGTWVSPRCEQSTVCPVQEHNRGHRCCSPFRPPLLPPSPPTPPPPKCPPPYGSHRANWPAKQTNSSTVSMAHDDGDEGRLDHNPRALAIPKLGTLKFAHSVGFSRASPIQYLR